MNLEANKVYSFRPYTPEDLNFIYSSWGSSYYASTIYSKVITPKEFHHFHKPIRENIMAKPKATAIVCVSTDDPTLILGWICVEEPPESKAIIMHYIYVKEAFKKEGIATDLIHRAIPKDKKILYTHRTERGGIILDRRRPHQFYFTPHLI
ncbi:MAG TPA: hypothetical protein PLQ20_02090 [Candidatus Paceibacterota bacterium]|nr:hypothetical protein [Candidatus Paceibacterota bacterium]